MDDTFWAAVSYVQMSANRRDVVRRLAAHNGSMTPTELAEDMEVVVKTASRAVRQLHERDLVECLNPDAPRNRRYRLTDTGRDIAAVLAHISDGDRTGVPADLALDQESLHTVADHEPDYAADTVSEDIQFVRLSTTRKAVINLLDRADIPLTPTDIHAEVDATYNSVSRTLRQLTEHGLTRCINPDAPRYRRYRLTAKGKTVLNQLQEHDT